MSWTVKISTPCLTLEALLIATGAPMREGGSWIVGPAWGDYQITGTMHVLLAMRAFFNAGIQTRAF